MSTQPQPPSFRSLLGLALTVVVALGLIAWGFSHGFVKASSFARFDFHKPPPPGAETAVDLRPFLNPTPQLLNQGQQVFQANCVPCHGPDGMGNGPRAAGLSPPPRNFHQTPGAPPFRFGTSVLTMFHTVTNGSPGTSMPSFVALSDEERMAVVQYVRQWIPKDMLQNNTSEQLADLNNAAAQGPAKLPPLNPVPTGPRIPIDVAMRIVAEEAANAYPTAPSALNTPAATAGADLNHGAAIYRARCATCHGGDGQGGIATQMVTSNPYLEVRAASFAQPHMLASMNDAAGFDRIVLHGLAGQIMPGYGDLTRPELDGLQAYIRQLAAAGPAPAATGGAQ